MTRRPRVVAMIGRQLPRGGALASAAAVLAVLATGLAGCAAGAVPSAGAPGRLVLSQWPGGGGPSSMPSSLVQGTPRFRFRGPVPSIRSPSPVLVETSVGSPAAEARRIAAVLHLPGTPDRTRAGWQLLTASGWLTVTSGPRGTTVEFTRHPSIWAGALPPNVSNPPAGRLASGAAGRSRIVAGSGTGVVAVPTAPVAPPGNVAGSIARARSVLEAIGLPAAGWPASAEAVWQVPFCPLCPPCHPGWCVACLSQIRGAAVAACPMLPAGRATAGAASATGRPGAVRPIVGGPVPPVGAWALITFTPTLDGRPVVDQPWTVSLGENGAVETLSGARFGTRLVGSYPLRSVISAVAALGSGAHWFPVPLLPPAGPPSARSTVPLADRNLAVSRPAVVTLGRVQLDWLAVSGTAPAGTGTYLIPAYRFFSAAGSLPPPAGGLLVTPALRTDVVSYRPEPPSQGWPWPPPPAGTPAG